VTDRRDDDAFRWEGDDEPVIEPDPPAESEAPSPAPLDDAGEAGRAGSAPALPDGYTAVGKGSETVGRIEADGTVEPDGTVEAHDGPAPLGNAALVAIGVLGGIYLLYAIGWIVGGSRLQVWVVSDAMFYASWWLAILAPVIWFGTVYVLTARSRLWLRFVWLIAGAVLLIPWPFLTVGPVPA
jgi:hypothetical protein